MKIQPSNTQMASMAIEEMSSNMHVQELAEGVTSLQGQINADAGFFNSTGKKIKKETEDLIAKERGETVEAGIKALGQIERTLIHGHKRLIEKEVMAGVQRLSQEVVNIHTQSQKELTKLANDPGVVLVHDEARRQIQQQVENGELSADFGQAMYDSHTEAGLHQIKKQKETGKNLSDHYESMKREALKIN